MNTFSLQRIQAAGWNFPETLWQSLSAYEKSFAVSEFSGLRTFDYYLQRLRGLGFSGLEKVLDAGCGMGQWSLALAMLNREVEAIDINQERLKVARVLAEQYDIRNCSFQYGSIENLDGPPNSLDAIFCYGVFMFTDMPCTLQCFYQRLKPGGLLYLNANTWGWYLHLLLDLGLRGRRWSILRDSVRMILRTWQGYPSQRVVTEKWLRSILAESNFEIIGLSCEGNLKPHLSAEEALKLPSAYASHYYGMRTILETLAIKK